MSGIKTECQNLTAPHSVHHGGLNGSLTNIQRSEAQQTKHWFRRVMLQKGKKQRKLARVKISDH